MILDLVIGSAIVIVGLPVLIALFAGQAMKDFARANGTPPTVIKND